MSVKKLFFYFATWRAVLLVFLAIAIVRLPLQENFLGGGISNYTNSPYLWAHINFDGEHYLAIAQRGYRDLEYFFFPLYPLVVRVVAQLFNDSNVNLATAGLALSHIAFLLGLYGLVKLLKLDYGKNVATYTVLLLLLFPTSFYFASFYTESLFLALTVWTFYFARKKNWLLAGLLGAATTATRVIGIALLPALLIEYIIVRRPLREAPLKVLKDKYFWLLLLLIPMGLVSYMYFLKAETGDPIEFFSNVSIFGQQRSSRIILLPQAFYRYIFKILPVIKYNYFPIVFTTWLEFLTAIWFGILGLVGVLGSLGKLEKLKIRWSYSIYLLLGYLIPTFSGSFSSLPRYVIVLFPAFIIFSSLVLNLKKPLRIALFALLFLSLGAATMLFSRGYWVS